MKIQKMAAAVVTAVFALTGGLTMGADEAVQYKTDTDIAYRSGPGLTAALLQRPMRSQAQQR